MGLTVTHVEDRVAALERIQRAITDRTRGLEIEIDFLRTEQVRLARRVFACERAHPWGRLRSWLRRVTTKPS